MGGDVDDGLLHDTFLFYTFLLGFCHQTVKQKGLSLFRVIWMGQCLAAQLCNHFLRQLRAKYHKMSVFAKWPHTL